MIKKTSLLTLFLLFAVHAFAQTFQVNVEFSKKDNTDSLKLYVGAMDKGSSSMQPMTQNGKKFTADIEASACGFYAIVGVKDGRQLSIPFYIADASKPAILKAKFEKDLICFTGNPDNEAISSYINNIVALEKEIWPGKPTEDKVRQIYGNLDELTKPAKGKKGVAPIVKQYIDMSAYVSAYNTIMQLPRILGVRASEVSLKPSDVLPPAKDVLDNDLCPIFGSASYIMINEMPRSSSLSGTLETIHSTYTTPVVRKSLVNTAVNSFVQRWNAEADFDGGLAQIKEATEKYGLSQQYTDAYMKRKPIPKGAAFPAEVLLKDTLGNVVPFDSFKGKYVYIDVWASWCGPCCKEVPYLQKLEAELENKDVVFVSISVDSTEAPWKKKMQELGMHGNQLFDASGKFCELMNIRGIPHFLIYDKDGCLMKSGATRPSNPETKKLLEGLK